MIDGRRPSDHVERLRQVRMRVGDLFRDSRDGMLSVVKTLSMITAIALTVGFVLQARYRDLEWMDYIAYALGMAMASSPTLAGSVFSTMAPRLAGISQPPPPATQPPDVSVTTTVTQPPKD